jgi:hypothetical protein
LQAEYCRDTELLLEPGNVFDPRVFTNKEGGENFAYLRSPASTVALVGGEGIIEVRHASKVEKRV